MTRKSRLILLTNVLILIGSIQQVFANGSELMLFNKLSGDTTVIDTNITVDVPAFLKAGGDELISVETINQLDKSTNKIEIVSYNEFFEGRNIGEEIKNKGSYSGKIFGLNTEKKSCQQKKVGFKSNGDDPKTVFLNTNNYLYGSNCKYAKF